jgi:hypothetical protein
MTAKTRTAKTRTPQQVGRANRGNGKRWQLDAADCLRIHGWWPNASYQVLNNASDITGTGDLAIEATLERWEMIATKLEQAERDAVKRGLTDFCVWKRRRYDPKDRSTADTARSFVIFEARIVFPMIARLQELERVLMDTAAEYDRGYRNGHAAATRDRIAGQKEAM